MTPETFLSLLPVYFYQDFNSINFYKDLFSVGALSVFTVLSVFNMKLIPDSLKKCPHGVVGGITREKCWKCSEEKIKEELREKWRDEDSHKLWEIFDDEKERKIRAEKEIKLKEEQEWKNQLLWDEEKLNLENRDEKLRKKIEEKNQVVWDVEVRHIAGHDDFDWKNSVAKNNQDGKDIIYDDEEVENAEDYDWNERKGVWEEIEKSLIEKESDKLSEEDVLFQHEIRQKIERIYQEEHEKINYLKHKNIRHLKGLTLKSFEKYILEMFKKLGYVTRVSRREIDAGKIIVLYKLSSKYLLLCKKYPENFQINVQEVEKLAMAIANQRAIGGFLVTTCNFSKPAFQIVKENKIEPVDNYLLAKMLNEAYPISYEDERIRTVCLKCGEIVYFNLFDSRESLPCRYGHEVSNLIQNRMIRL